LPRLMSAARELDPGSQYFGDAPRLSDTAARRERRFRVENFADRPDARIVHVRHEPVEHALGANEVIRIHLQPGVDERADETDPDRALVIRRIARAEVSEVARLVF